MTRLLVKQDRYIRAWGHALKLLLFSLCLTVPALNLTAEEITEGTGERKVELSVALEVRGLEPALMNASDAVNRLVASLEEVSKHPDMDKAYQQKLVQTLEGMDQIGQEFQKMLNQIPQTVERTGEPVLSAFERFSSQVKSWIIIIGGALLVVVTVALALCYFFVIAPASRVMLETSYQIKSLSDNLKDSADLVVQVAEMNEKTSQRLERIEGLAAE